MIKFEDEIWKTRNGDFEEYPKDIKDFVLEIDNICKKYNISISHEDYYGAFLIDEYDEDNIQWLANCNDSR